MTVNFSSSSPTFTVCSPSTGEDTVKVSLDEPAPASFTSFFWSVSDPSKRTFISLFADSDPSFFSVTVTLTDSFDSTVFGSNFKPATRTLASSFLKSITKLSDTSGYLTNEKVRVTCSRFSSISPWVYSNLFWSTCTRELFLSPSTPQLTASPSGFTSILISGSFSPIFFIISWGDIGFRILMDGVSIARIAVSTDLDPK